MARLVSGVVVIGILLVLLKRWSTQPSKSQALIIAVLSIGLSSIGGTIIATPMLGVAMVMLLKAFGKTACFICIAAVALEAFIGHSILNSSLVTIIRETLWMLVICLLYFLLATVLLVLEQERTHSEQLAMKVIESSSRDRDLAVAAERTAAARMLHDGLGQQLVAISMSLGLAKNLHTADAWSEVDHAKEITDQALTDLRRWVRTLDPPATKVPANIDELEESLVVLSDAFATTGISFMIRSLGDNFPLTPAQGELLQVVAREGVSNALRHGDPTAIRFTLETNHDTITLSVVNTSAEPTPKEIVTGYGLRSIEQRTAALGGTSSSDFTTDGFSLTVSIPTKTS